jgi:RHS repeat-associated protein
LEEAEGGGAGATTYSWDPLGELIGVEGPGGSVSSSYDALGRLASRASGGTTGSVHYADLGDAPILAAPEGGPSVGYLQGPARLLVETEEGGTASWPLLDGHGSVVATVEGSGGIESRRSYGPWGEMLEGGASGTGYLGGYGRLTDPTTGIVQMGARPYDPTLGAFLSQDPVLGHTSIPATLDPYPYVADNPLTLYDLMGRDPFEDIVGAIGGAAEGVAGAAVGLGETSPTEAVNFVESAAGKVAEAPDAVAGAYEAVWRTAGQEDEFASERAQEFVKAAKPPVERVYEFAGSNWQNCAEGAGALAPGGAIIGGFFGPEAIAPGAVIGGSVGCAGVVAANEILSP